MSWPLEEVLPVEGRRMLFEWKQGWQRGCVAGFFLPLEIFCRVSSGVRDFFSERREDRGIFFIGV